MPHLKFVHRFRCPAEKLWASVCSSDDLVKVSKPIIDVIALNGMPARFEEGQTIATKLKLLKVPWGKHQIHFRKLDHARKRFETEEAGTHLKRWEHVFWLEQSPEGCVCFDEINFDAGIWNPFVLFYGQIVYRWRYRQRKRLIKA